MSFQRAVSSQRQGLPLLRGELSLQSHLFRAEVRDRWQALERRWESYVGHVLNACNALAEPAPEIGFAFEQLHDALEHEYRAFRQSVYRNSKARRSAT